MDMLRDVRTPHDPETGEVVGEAVKPPRAPTAAQLAVQSRAKQRGYLPDIGEGPDIRMSGTMSDALRGMVDRVYLKSQNWQTQQWKADRKGAHPTILEFEKVFIARMKKLGVPFYAHCVIRTELEQAKLFREGVSKDSPEDGIWPHRGCAVDLVHGTKHWNLTKAQWALVGHVGKELATQRGLKVEWGGDWKFWDPAHWQVQGFKQLMGEYPWPSE